MSLTKNHAVLLAGVYNAHKARLLEIAPHTMANVCEELYNELATMLVLNMSQFDCYEFYAATHTDTHTTHNVE